RKQMILSLWGGEMSVSQASRQYGVTRKTVRKWLSRAEEEGIERLSEVSRAPHRIPNRTDEERQTALLMLKDLYPEWGAKKLCEILRRDYGVDLPVRTADRILSRNGRVVPRQAKTPLRNFEYEAPNLVNQMDFKGMPKSLGFSVLTVIDDASRMCVFFAPVKDRTGETVFGALWNVFGEIGMPESYLMDNGDCWGTSLRRCPTAFEARLWRLGIRTMHSRPAHPQTQGKVERFHRTAKLEMGASLISYDKNAVHSACQEFKERYNWVRPHEALGGRVPGSVFTFSKRKRPDKEPEAILLEGMAIRKVMPTGYFSFKGKDYRIGKGLAGEYIQIAEEELGYRTYYTGFPMIYLS
ncbi:MAG: IS481 family transposase, partial [Bacillota bacterium]